MPGLLRYEGLHIIRFQGRLGLKSQPRAVFSRRRSRRATDHEKHDDGQGDDFRGGHCSRVIYKYDREDARQPRATFSFAWQSEQMPKIRRE